MSTKSFPCEFKQRLKFKKNTNYCSCKFLGKLLYGISAIFLGGVGVLSIVAFLYNVIITKMLSEDFFNHSSVYLKFLVPIVVLGLSERWREDTKFGRKWVYCASLYNDLFVKSPSTQSVKFEYQKSTFCIDLLDLGLWKHKSYWRLFNEVFAAAFKQYSKTATDVEVSEISNGKISITKAREILSVYQNKLVDDINRKGSSEKLGEGQTVSIGLAEGN